MDFMQNLRQKLSELPQERLLDYVEIQLNNLWTLQNNYMFRIEEKYGHEVATEFDTMCYGRMSEVAVKRLIKFLNLGDDIESMMVLLEYLPPEPGSQGESIQTGKNKLLCKCTTCEMQMARVKRGAPELACKPALVGVMDKTFKAINPKAKIIHAMAPPDPHPDDLWCEFEIEISD